MFKFRKILTIITVAFCFSSNLKLISAGVPPETKKQQYNGILADADLLSIIRASYDKKDNLAAIRVGERTFHISSSILNGFLLKDVLPGNLKTEADLLYPAGVNPIFVMDLLYMYRDDYTNLIDGANLQAKIVASKQNDKRKLIEKMLKIVVKGNAQHAPGDILIDIQSIIDEGDDALGTQFNGATPDDAAKSIRLDSLKDAIVDFLHRLRKYAEDTGYIERNGDIVFQRTNHLIQDKQKLTHFNIDQGTKQLDKPGAIEILLERIDKNLIGNAPRNYIVPVVTIELISNLIQYIHKMVSSPWSKDPKEADVINYLDRSRLTPLADISQTIAAITHTEQIVDWISSKFGGAISL